MTIQEFGKIDMIGNKEGVLKLVIADPGDLVDEDRLYALETKARGYLEALEDPAFRDKYPNWPSAMISVVCGSDPTEAMKKVGPFEATIDGKSISVSLEFERMESSLGSTPDDQKVRLIDPAFNMGRLTEQIVGIATSDIQHGSFSVVAMSLDYDGKGGIVNVDMVEPDQRVGAAREAIKRVAAKETTLAVAVAFDVLAVRPGESEKSDAIAIEIEHRSGDAQMRFVHYEKAGDQITTQRAYGSIERPKFFGHGTTVVSDDTSAETGSNSEMSDEEKEELLAQAPSMCFLLVAAIDGNISKKELIAFAGMLETYSAHDNPIVRSVFSQTMNRFQADVQELLALKEGMALMIPLKLAMCRAVLNRSYPQHSEGFVNVLLELSKGIAEADGGFLGFGDKISKEERAALGIIESALRAS